MLVGACVDRFTAANGLRDYEDLPSARELFAKCVTCETGQHHYSQTVQLNHPSRKGIIAARVAALQLRPVESPAVNKLTSGRKVKMPSPSEVPLCRVCTLPTEARNLGMDGRCNACKTQGRVKDGAGPPVKPASAQPPAVTTEDIQQYLKLLSDIDRAKRAKREFEEQHPGVIGWLRKMMEEA